MMNRLGMEGMKISTRANSTNDDNIIQEDRENAVNQSYQLRTPNAA